jgi:uncharacterized cupin superfamily protein
MRHNPAMVDEARPAETELGLLPQNGGWYVVNARETRWVGTDDMWRGAWIEPEEEWPALGFRLTVLDPGKPMARYHAESVQEEFLIVEGEAILLVEGEERRLRKWDFVHCPPWTEHVLVGAGDGPCVVAAVSTREPGSEVRYVASELARKYGAAPEEDTSSPAEAYRGTSEPRLLRYRDGDLP